jgi:hypothetical protein
MEKVLVLVPLTTVRDAVPVEGEIVTVLVTHPANPEVTIVIINVK